MLVTKTSRFASKGRQTNVPQTSQLVVHELTFGDQSSMTTAGASLDTSTMFENNANTDYVQNAVGDVSAGTTVEQIRVQYPELDDLIGNMLRLEPAPAITPAASGFSVTWFNFSNSQIEVGSVNTITPMLQVYRGSWSPAATLPSPNPPPLGLVTGASYTDAFLGTPKQMTFQSHTDSNASLTTQGVAVNIVPSALGNIVYDTASVDFAQGTEVFNNYNTAFQEPARSISVSNTITLQVHAPLYRNNGVVNTTAIGAAGVAGTDKIFAGTSYGYVTAHEITEVVESPLEPHGFAQHNPLFSSAPWAACVLNTEWTKVQVTRTVGTKSLIYWEIRWIGTGRGPADIRLSF